MAASLSHCLRLGGVRSRSHGLCLGIAALQGRVAAKAGSWKSIPPVHSGSQTVRFASGFSPMLCNSFAVPFVSPATQLNSVIGNVACSNSLSILKRTTTLIPDLFQQPSRTKTYFSLRKGKSKTVRSVVKRFLRLHCGLWVRKKAGYKKKLWKKRPARKKRLREIVFCNKQQSRLLDKMTSSFWKRRNWFADDPYQKYHDRTNLKL